MFTDTAKLLAEKAKLTSLEEAKKEIETELCKAYIKGVGDMAVGVAKDLTGQKDEKPG